MTDTDVMAGFVSMGKNCEIGAAQRAYGAEPLDLLRWANTPVSVLLALLCNRFDGLGDPDKLVISRAKAGRLIAHTGYGFEWHAWSNETDDAILARERKRLPFLARKMMEDLTEGHRIFVVRKGGGDWTPGDEGRILSAMSAYGNATLLHVSVEPVLSMRREAPRLLHGTMFRFGDPGDVLATTPAADWLAMFRMARQYAGM